MLYQLSYFRSVSDILSLAVGPLLSRQGGAASEANVQDAATGHALLVSGDLEMVQAGVIRQSISGDREDVVRALREGQEVLAVAKDAQSLCPGAWVINYINPTAVLGLTLKRYAPALKSFALCDGNRMPHVRRSSAVRAGIIPQDDEYTPEVDSRFDLRIAGPNHFTWIIVISIIFFF